MRIIAGSAGGLKLNTAEGLATRPTADRVKEALFSSLGERLYGSRVLDAFAGSGALALEALSRGAESAVLCENNKSAFSICKGNIEKTRFQNKASLLLTDAVSYIAQTDEKFDIVFIDPPYGSGLYEKVLALLPKALNKNAIVVVEFEEKYKPSFPNIYIEEKSKKYGRVHLAYLGIGESNSAWFENADFA